ncbi:hypothetical protein [Vibrio rumoiensis]|uniref:hypothetical protein n=1 Tax=Vibrio rumoiensis TaxID=76258 RepID=UPI003AA81D53
MSELRQVGSNEWVGPEDFGITPHLSYTDYAQTHYKRGNVKHEQLMPGNHIVPIDYGNSPNTEHMGEYLQLYGAGGHETFLDMRVESSHSRGNILYSMLLAVFLWGGISVWMRWLGEGGGI